MNRIMVIGAPGSGKSTLARDIGARRGLPVVHIDQIHWQPGWVQRPRAQAVALARQAAAGDRWVFEGGLSETWPDRAARADLVVWLDLPLTLRLWRVLRRWWRYRGQTRPDLPADCPERLAPEFLWYIVSTVRRGRRNAQALIDSLPPGKGVHLRSPGQVARWLDADSPRPG